MSYRALAWAAEQKAGSNKPHYVYVISASISPEQGPVKVGYSQNVAKRLKQLQPGSHDKLYIHFQSEFLSLEIAKAVEEKFHTDFSESRMSGEWFGISAVEAMQHLGGYTL